jgi:hypothetical protein
MIDIFNINPSAGLKRVNQPPAWVAEKMERIRPFPPKFATVQPKRRLAHMKWLKHILAGSSQCSVRFICGVERPLKDDE